MEECLSWGYIVRFRRCGFEVNDFLKSQRHYCENESCSGLSPHLKQDCLLPGREYEGVRGL
jgi:hypothetical protein